MTAGYDLGRRAASGEANLLDLVRVHHQIVTEVLDQRPAPPTAQVLDAACEFLSEVLSTFDMAHRVRHDPPSPRTRSFRRKPDHGTRTPVDAGRAHRRGSGGCAGCRVAGREVRCRWSIGS